MRAGRGKKKKEYGRDQEYVQAHSVNDSFFYISKRKEKSYYWKEQRGGPR